MTTNEPQQTNEPRKRNPWLIGAGIVAGALLVGGGGIAIGAAIGDNDRDQAAVSNTTEGAGDQGSGSDDATPTPSITPSEDVADDVDDMNDTDADASAGLAPADARSLTGAITKAVSEVSGVGAVAIEVERDGWDVDVRLENGGEADVFVSVDGATTVRDRDNDGDNDPLIDTKHLPKLKKAALEAAGGGQIESISTENGPVLYEVSVNLGGDRDVDVELDKNLRVLQVD